MNLEKKMENHLNDNRRGERLRNGVRAVIIGAPNVGKSSFLNLICQKSISIVTNIEGTTRDIIESHYNIGDYPIILADTAGLRKKTQDLVEIEGISRALNYIKLSDLILLIIDVTKLIEFNYNLENYKKNYLNELGLNFNEFNKIPKIIIINKIDLLNDNQLKKLKSNINDNSIILLSCKKLYGQNNLINIITKNLEIICGCPNEENPVISQERHRFLINESLINLKEFNLLLSSIDSNSFIDFAILAQKLRMSLRSLGQITGEVSNDEILDVIFKDFCIGK